MSTKPQAQPPTDQKASEQKARELKATEQQAKERQQRSSEIGKHVLRNLGKPGGRHSVQVRQLWPDHYRVNVFVGEDTASASVAHSYFVVTNSDGIVVKANPQITKRY